MADDMDFNGADSQDAAFDLIPANTLVKLCLTIRPGGAGPEGWLTQSKTSSALYLNTEAVVLEGPYARRRIYTRIGFRGKDAGGPGEDSYANRGRALIRGILESARGIRAADQSERRPRRAHDPQPRRAQRARPGGEDRHREGQGQARGHRAERHQGRHRPGPRRLPAADGRHADAGVGAAPSASGYTGARVIDNPHAGPATPAGGAAPFWAR